MEIMKSFSDIAFTFDTFCDIKVSLILASATRHQTSFPVHMIYDI